MQYEAMVKEIHEALKPLREGKRDGGTMGKISEVDDKIEAMLMACKPAPLKVYGIFENYADERIRWVKIGSAYENKDDSINVLLEALPINGRLQIRKGREVK